MTLNWKQLVLVATLGSVALLGGAFVFQALGYAPCKMCYWQRYPHAVAILIGVVALALGRRWLAWLGALAALTTSGIGVFHSGVERDLWEGPSSCTGGSTAGLSTDDLMDQIMSAPLVRCDEIPWEMFGVTMANLNALISLALAVIWVIAARRAAA
ncbi:MULTISPECIES: disulfide bond formation protein B [Maritimibacter]|uniref:Disulfide bond formation protein, DsbB family protein n=1 Tax=Maritimibacter alkaliphilus HTCC2654 TaxID=314271 RepID=A3VKD3_9RHOB|nr:MULTISPECIES: disulfide bond formation protein B [Maritimibacter]EAQ11257.1 disulfide bond formation protein, DsbB family protein [Maritimibacter alkaliphilus HTCC2654]MBL6429481.1 disulfide bond formation protein B [Maritimibacter sp.]TYP81476.1 disulfide bond formation protein DsbB [Maritimibacter alkaliphilus HTCC2654]